jgi:hypothetical protein
MIETHHGLASHPKALSTRSRRGAVPVWPSAHPSPGGQLAERAARCSRLIDMADVDKRNSGGSRVTHQDISRIAWCQMDQKNVEVTTASTSSAATRKRRHTARTISNAACPLEPLGRRRCRSETYELYLKSGGTALSRSK